VNYLCRGKATKCDDSYSVGCVVGYRNRAGVYSFSFFSESELNRGLILFFCFLSHGNFREP
jgi:hypothetical protein